MKKIAWILFALLCIFIGLYPSFYFINDRKFGLLNSKSPELLSNIFWNAAFYTHIILGGLALLIGWVQFSPKFRKANIQRHQLIGKIYTFSVFLSAVAGFYIALFATGGLIPAMGFSSLSVVWFYTTLMAYQSIRKNQIQQHRQMMFYSYSACFAAVTLRIWLPLLMMLFGEFMIAYKIVAWLCWVPNLLVAYFIIRRRSAAESVSLV